MRAASHPIPLARLLPPRAPTGDDRPAVIVTAMAVVVGRPSAGRITP
jgi:hypothetical protein